MMTADLLTYLRAQPGRCYSCGCHWQTQPHAPGCALAAVGPTHQGAVQAAVRRAPDVLKGAA